MLQRDGVALVCRRQPGVRRAHGVFGHDLMRLARLLWHENVCQTVRVMPGVRSRCIRGSRIDDWAVAGATV